MNQTSIIFIYDFSALFLRELLNRQRSLAAAMGLSGSLMQVV